MISGLCKSAVMMCYNLFFVTVTLILDALDPEKSQVTDEFAKKTREIRFPGDLLIPRSLCNGSMDDNVLHVVAFDDVIVAGRLIAMVSQFHPLYS